MQNKPSEQHILRCKALVSLQACFGTHAVEVDYDENTGLSWFLKIDNKHHLVFVNPVKDTPLCLKIEAMSAMTSLGGVWYAEPEYAKIRAKMANFLVQLQNLCAAFDLKICAQKNGSYVDLVAGADSMRLLTFEFIDEYYVNAQQAAEKALGE